MKKDIEVKTLEINKLIFNSTENEQWREYVWGDGYVLRITEPLWVNVSKSGGHRVIDKAQRCYYVASGWRYITWEGKGDFTYQW